MQHLVLSKSLVLVEVPVPKPNASASKPASGGINHIWEIDRSGSMSWLLPQLVKDLKTKVRELPAGDTISLGWFSGNGEKSFVLKGFPIGTDFTALDRALDSFARSVGMTCFSEILADTKQVIAETAAIHGDKFALCFFTDGYPTVGNYGREVESILTAIDAIKGKLTASLVVGYGDYYNKELLARMSERLAGSLIHSSDLPTFSVAFKTFTEDARGATGKAVDVSYEGCLGVQLLFSLNGKQVNVLPSGKAPIVQVPLTDRVKDNLYVLAAGAPYTSKEVKLTDKAFVGRTAAQEGLIKGAYAAAMLLTQRTKTDQALEVLGALGDVALIDAINNAFTAAEYGSAEAQLVEAMAGPSKRLTKGRNTTYLPKDDAFCLLDLLDLLKDASFLPGHKGFDYKRTGVASENKEGFGKFMYAPDASTKLDTFVWNNERLNLSVQANIKGTVNLQPRDGKVAADFGLLENYPTAIYRNFTIVKDGALNVMKLPITGVSGEVGRKLMSIGIVDSVSAAHGTPESQNYVLDLTKVPVMNRAMANGRTSAKALCKLVGADLDMRSELKALKYYRDQIEEATEAAQALTKVEDSAMDFLTKNGIDLKRGCYSPQKDAGESIDYYDARTFEIAIKGASSLPKVVDVEAKLADAKAMAKGLKTTEIGLAKGIKFWQSLTGTDTVKLVQLDERIKEVNVEQRKNRRAIQETKFAIILGKKWFDEFTSREDGVIDQDGRTFTFKLGTEQVKF